MAFVTCLLIPIHLSLKIKSTFPFFPLLLYQRLNYGVLF